MCAGARSSQRPKSLISRLRRNPQQQLRSNQRTQFLSTKWPPKLPCARRVSRSKARDPRLSRAFVQDDQEARKRAMQLGLKDRGSPFVRIMNTHDIACSPLESLHVFHLGILKVRHLLALFSSSRYSHASGSRRRGSPAPLSLV